MKLLLTCEHASNFIPEEYLCYFEADASILNTHRGYDPGAFSLFKKLKPLSFFNQYQPTGRLLVEVNRSLHHPNLFSEFTKQISSEEKEKILKRYYLPYRDSIENKISEVLKKERERVFHCSVHTFTPVFNGKTRKADIGVLFDPSKKWESELSQKLKARLLEKLPNATILFNSPYLGKADGFTTYLRNKFSENYAGIEVEVNQKWVYQNEMEQHVKLAIFEALLGIIK